MSKVCVFSLFLALVLISSGCQSTKTRAVEGGVIGGVLGAAAGGIIGHQSGHGGEGAGIGAGVGAVTGAIIGSQIEKPDEYGQDYQSSASSGQMSMSEIISLSGQGVEDSVIIDKIRLSDSRFDLSSEDISYLRRQGVSYKVIDAMMGIY